ncbi:site-specific integrase [Nocardioides sp. WL0053]|uniref:Site-specific integrase n=1 Tax=Nocardioides jiangsuensis TaxID=2866161 RepID=A0ABS7RGQ2_9ACTN|nr:site-specific integrase [Nocardioides jiangsuensis]MBY9074225.1 site-specific integrase [Nocardioides jiangsuensis]
MSHTQTQPSRGIRGGKTGLRPGALVALMAADDDRHDRDLTEVGDAIAVVEAELIEDDQQALPGDLIDAVLDAYLENGRLVPAKHAEVSGLAPSDTRRLERARMLDKLRASAFADSTLHSYGYGVTAWRNWCRREGVPALPFDPLNVANHLIDYAFSWEEMSDEVRRDEDGNAVNAVMVGTVELRLASLNKAAEFLGMPKPGDNEGVRELMRGLRRTFLSAKQHQKRALTHDLLLRCLEATTGRTLAAQRVRGALLLRARTEATAGQLEALSWADVTLTADAVALELAPVHRHGRTREIVVAAHPTNPALCLVGALRSLRTISARLDRVFAHASGTPLTRQALHLAVHKAAAPAGGWAAAPGLSDRELARVIVDGALATPLQSARDRALLLTGFWGALRRSNLSALNWSDLVDHGEDGVEVILRKSKTDQEGVGTSVWAPPSETGSGTPCPATALRQWHTQLTAALGRTPLPNEPVFVSLSGGGTLRLNGRDRLTRLPGEGINEIVQRLTIAAGITAKPKQHERNPFGAHSLRAGFVTEAAMAGMSIPEIMGVTKHKSPQIVMEYVRLTREAKQNASRRLLGQIGRQAA